MNLLTKLLKPKSQKKKVHFAVIGLGNFAQEAILPAFANTQDKAELTALVSGDAEKAEELSKKYKVPTYSYEEYEALLSSGKIDAVYIAVPNSEHRKFVEIAAKARVHVLCEKPLAYSVKDARAIVNVCQRNKVRLMTAYRLHFEDGNLNAIEIAHSGKIGDPRLFTSIHTMQITPGNIRTDLSLGGGPLEDIGIYCLNAARYLFKAEPEEVTAFAIRGHDRRFKEIPEAVSATLRFPGNKLATFLCGFGETKVSEYRLIGTEGLLKMDPAFTWHSDVVQTVSHNGKEKKKTFEHRDQIAAEIVYFSDCILKKKNPEPSGHEGLNDVRIIDALRRSYRAHRTVRLPPLEKKRRPRQAQSIKRAPHKRPKPVKSPPPSR
jgi:glucose-fructose oxidoreductase